MKDPRRWLFERAGLGAAMIIAAGASLLVAAPIASADPPGLFDCSSSKIGTVGYSSVCRTGSGTQRITYHCYTHFHDDGEGYGSWVTVGKTSSGRCGGARVARHPVIEQHN